VLTSPNDDVLAPDRTQDDSTLASSLSFVLPLWLQFSPFALRLSLTQLPLHHHDLCLLMEAYDADDSAPLAHGVNTFITRLVNQISPFPKMTDDNRVMPIIIT